MASHCSTPASLLGLVHQEPLVFSASPTGVHLFRGQRPIFMGVHPKSKTVSIRAAVVSDQSQPNRAQRRGARPMSRALNTPYRKVS